MYINSHADHLSLSLCIQVLSVLITKQDTEIQFFSQLAQCEVEQIER